MVLWSTENDRCFYFVKQVEIVNTMVNRKLWNANVHFWFFFFNCDCRSHINNAKSTQQWKLQNDVYYIN